MEYVEPLITCDKILKSFIKEGASSYQIEGNIFTEFGGKGNGIINQAMHKLIDVDVYILRGNNGYCRLSGTASEFIAKGGYEGLCKRSVGENELKAQKELQENQIRQLDIMIKVDQVVDYPTVKRQRRNAYIFGAMSVLIAIVAYLQYLKCK